MLKLYRMLTARGAIPAHRMSWFSDPAYGSARRGRSLQSVFEGIEAEHRRDLIASLSSSFVCYEEVDIEHPLFDGLLIRADVVALPVDDDLWRHALAFEVKSYSEDASYSKWSAATKQASDYVLGRIRSDIPNLAGRRISASFVYPAPDYVPYVPRSDVPTDISNRMMIAGIFHCAIHWRVGQARDTGRDGFRLGFGPNELWTTKRGFSGQAQALLDNKRRIGSRSVDVCSLLDGFGARMPECE